jgi:Excalibur calcium-binding domain
MLGVMPWEPRRQARAKGWLPRPKYAARRLHVPFWAGWAALIAAAAVLYLVSNQPILSPTGHRAGYQCWRNAYDCRDFCTRSEAQAAYRACGGLRDDVHRLDRDRDGLACERLP